MRSDWSKVGSSSSMTGVLIQRGERNTEREDRNVTTEAEIEVPHLQGKEGQRVLAGARSRRRQGSLPPYRAQRERGLNDTSIPDFWNCEIISFCCFKPPTLWLFFRATLGIKHSTLTLLFPHRLLQALWGCPA